MRVSLPREMMAELEARGTVTRVNLGALAAAAAGGTELTVSVPVPPSTNNLFLTVKRKRGGTVRVKSPEYRAWLKEAVPLLARLRRPERFPVRVVVSVFGKVNQARDIDNCAKAVSDGLVEARVIPGDSIGAGVWETLQRYRPDGPDGVAVVTIERVEG